MKWEELLRESVFHPSFDGENIACIELATRGHMFTSGNTGIMIDAG
jgi:hypothetical protein